MVKRSLISIWNRFVDGFETGVVALVVMLVGAGDALDLYTLQSYLPEKFGWVVSALGVSIMVARFAITLPWFKRIEEKNAVVAEPF